MTQSLIYFSILENMCNLLVANKAHENTFMMFSNFLKSFGIVIYKKRIVWYRTGMKIELGLIYDAGLMDKF